MLRARSRILHIFATSHMAIRLIATCTVTHGAHAPHGGQHRLAILRGGGSSPPRLPRTQNPAWLRYRSTINGLKEGEPERQDTETWATACRHLAGVCDLALLEGGTCELLAMHGDSLIKTQVVEIIGCNSVVPLAKRRSKIDGNISSVKEATVTVNRAISNKNQVRQLNAVIEAGLIAEEAAKALSQHGQATVVEAVCSLMVTKLGAEGEKGVHALAKSLLATSAGETLLNWKGAFFEMFNADTTSRDVRLEADRVDVGSRDHEPLWIATAYGAAKWSMGVEMSAMGEEKGTKREAENSACRAFIKEHRPEAVLPFLADIEYFQRGRQAWVAKASFGGVSVSSSPMMTKVEAEYHACAELCMALEREGTGVFVD